jgi:hypothetical protein
MDKSGFTVNDSIGGMTIHTKGVRVDVPDDILDDVARIALRRLFHNFGVSDLLREMCQVVVEQSEIKVFIVTTYDDSTEPTGAGEITEVFHTLNAAALFISDLPAVDATVAQIKEDMGYEFGQDDAISIKEWTVKP